MKIIILIVLLFPFVSFSQLIKSNQTDVYTGQKRIVTKNVDVNPDIFKNGLESISFTTVNDAVFIVLHGDGKSAGTIMQEDIALLVTVKDTLIVKSIGTQVSYGRYDPNNYDHQYSIAKDDLVKLSKNKLLMVRRFSSEGIFDQPVNEKRQSKIMELCDALLKEMKIN